MKENIDSYFDCRGIFKPDNNVAIMHTSSDVDAKKAWNF